MPISLDEWRAFSPDRAAVRQPVWTLVPSLFLHGLFLLALAFTTLGHPVVVVPERSIQVEIITSDDFFDAVELPSAQSSQPLAAPSRSNETEVVPSQPKDDMTTATNLLANRILSDPLSRELRETLPTLDRTERVIQLCSIEGLEQLRLAQPGTLPDSIAPSAFESVNVDGYSLVAPAAAYRVARKWYAVHYTCTIAPDFESVTEFRFQIGDAIPESDWDSHDLIAEDEDE